MCNDRKLYRITALDANCVEIGSYVFEGTRERVSVKTLSELAKHGVIPARLSIQPVINAMHG